MKITINNIAQIQTGVYLKNSPYADTVYLQVSDYDNQGNMIHSLVPTVEVSEKNKHHYLTPNDILFAAKGTNNFSAIFQGYENRCVASSSFLIVRLRHNQIILPAYLNWYLNLPSTLSKLSKEAVGTAIPSITKTTLGELEIPVPSLEKQQIIVKVAALQEKERAIRQLLAEKKDIMIDNLLKNSIL
ncbi:MAG: restriction endonuclease subunit S [Bacteroidales bacterium]